MMKFGVNTWVWGAPLTTEKLEELAPHVSEMGFDLIEIPIEDPTDLDYDRAADIITEQGLAVSVAAVMAPGRDLVHPDETVRQNGASYLRECIEAADTLGASHVIGPMYAETGRTWETTADEREEELDLLSNQLLSLAQYADERDSILCIEPLNRYETSFINTTDQALDVIDRVDHPACQLLIDTFHLNIEDRELKETITEAGSQLRYVHACGNDRGAPGSGHIPWQEIAEGLHNSNYDGPVVVESFTPEVESIARAASIWRSLAPTQDTLATEGLAFLRELLDQDTHLNES
jgi:D-psicose/D-tagatose/L-ribulose 3-epimerase